MIKLILGDYTFTRLEIPGNIPVGGDHRLVVHELVGGTRIVDAMGKSFDPIKWSGLFLGEGALQKAKYLDQLRKQGKVMSLNWSTMNYMVIIQQFQYTFEREYKIPYSITCVVISDLSDPVPAPVVDVDQAMRDDIGDAEYLIDDLEETPEVPKTTIKSKFEELKSAFNKAKSFVRATQAQIKKIKNTIQDVQKEITVAIAAVNNTVQDITTLGGILPNNSVSMNALKLGRNVSSINNMSQLMNLKYTLTRLDKNVTTQNPATVVPSMVTITVIAGTNLFQLAAKYYGDASKWETIARANKLTEPYVTANMIISIPKTPMRTA